MTPTPPFWFHQRQCKAEPAGNDTLRLTGPNLREAFIMIRPGESDHWSAALRLQADGADVAATGPEYPTADEAWAAAFELYRRHIVV